MLSTRIAYRLIAALVAVAAAVPVRGQPMDYGDAPEGALAYPSLGVGGQFPTCRTVGPLGWVQHTNFGAILGSLVDLEGDGNAGLCPGFSPYDFDECFADIDAGLLVPPAYTIQGGVVVPCTAATGSLGIVCQTATWGGNVDIQVSNNMPNLTDGFMNVLMDWNRDGRWSGSATCPTAAAPEHVLINFLIPNGFTGPLSALNPPPFLIGPQPGFVWTRFTISEQPVSIDWNGEGAFEDGESEDYLLQIDPQPQEEIDWGDAPDPTYPTLAVSNGASHFIIPGVFLGASVDGEPDGQPDPNALGDDNDGNDDEDGVVFTTPLIPGQAANLIVTASVPGLLDAWIDYNGDGGWVEPIDPIFVNQPLNPGANALNFNVPAAATAGAVTFARFRFSTAGGLSFDGPAPDGEVEDYQVIIEQGQELDWGDAPDPTYPTLAANNGASHVIVVGSAVFLGASIDGEPDGQQDPNALGDDNDGNDDEDGVLFTTPLIPGQPASVDVTAAGPGMLDVWIDYNADGSWAQAIDQVFASQPLISGLNTLNFNVPASASPNVVTFARFRYSTAGGLNYDGPATDGEVEDYQVLIEPLQALHDLGDAPDSTNNFGVPMTAYPVTGVMANYPTVFQDPTGFGPWGPIHNQPLAVANLGANVSLEQEADIGPDQDPTNNIDPPNDQPDLDKFDDGVNVPLILPHCDSTTTFSYTITVTAPGPDLFVNVWFDWNRDGDWDDLLDCGGGVFADEWAVQNQPIPIGAPGTYGFTTPPFTPWHPFSPPPEIWMRITLAEQPWQPGAAPGYGGSGPLAGYEFGETEDYFFTPGIQFPSKLKWDQPPDPTIPADPLYYGWNEYSVWDDTGTMGLVVADDWYCDTSDPVTGIRWWGSFVGWNSAELPAVLPDHFHIHVWTDVPADPADPASFSHPGQVIHEIICTNFTYTWVGWDYDPINNEYEGCFQFEQTLFPNEYFYQEPGGNIYWLSIAAHYLPGVTPQYPWGWKSRPRDPNSLAPDDAVRIFNPQAPDIAVNNLYIDGAPIFWPTPNESWDMAFELLSQQPGVPPKWEQQPDPALPGLHAHDSGSGANYTVTTLADQWQCPGGEVLDLHWYGNYELDPAGAEKRGSGIASFDISIHDDQPGVPWCLPGTIPWSLTVPFSDVTETDTGLINNEGCKIYLYEYNLPNPFPQIQGNIYWLALTALSVDPTNPAVWRWQEAGRTPAPIICPAASQTGPVPSPWTSIEWPTPPPSRWSDLAFAITSGPTVVPYVKWSQPPEPYVPDDGYNGWNEMSVYASPQIGADDWRCQTDFPVTDIHWWGSFIGWGHPYPPQMPDAFHIGIWTEAPQLCPPAGPYGPFSCPDILIHEIYCTNFTWQFVGWDWDPRAPLPGEPPVPPEACFRFDQELNFNEWFFQDPGDNIYWLSIAAVYNTVPNQYFWGWKTRPRDPQSPAPDDAVVIFDPTAPVLGSQYVAGGPLWYPDPIPENSWDYAFQLTTLDCTLLCDMNMDGLINGEDIQCFCNCLIYGFSMASPTCNPACADANGDGYLNMADIPPFVNTLLTQ